MIDAGARSAPLPERPLTPKERLVRGYGGGEPELEQFDRGRGDVVVPMRRMWVEPDGTFPPSRAPGGTIVPEGERRE